jgi:hypothetical protein
VCRGSRERATATPKDGGHGGRGGSLRPRRARGTMRVSACEEGAPARTAMPRSAAGAPVEDGASRRAAQAARTRRARAGAASAVRRTALGRRWTAAWPPRVESWTAPRRIGGASRGGPAAHPRIRAATPLVTAARRPGEPAQAIRHAPRPAPPRGPSPHRAAPRARRAVADTGRARGATGAVVCVAGRRRRRRPGCGDASGGVPAGSGTPGAEPEGPGRSGRVPGKHR